LFAQIKMLFIWLLAFVSLSGFEIEAVVDLPLPLSTAEMVSLDPFETVRLILEADPDMDQAFWTFEAHSQDNDDNLILSKSVPTPTGPSLLQMNVEDFTVLNHPGVVVFRTELGNESKPFTYLTNTANKNTTMVLFVKGFTNKYPVPGFHNNSEAKNALHVTWGMNTVSVEFDNAAFLNNSSPIITYSVYQHYLSERNFDKDNYLSKLTTTMLRLDDIIENGNLVDDDFVKSNATPSGGNRVVFSAYPGTAVLFSVVVTTIYPDVNGSDLELSSVYVTSSTYACQLNSNEPLNCQVMWYTITKVVCGISVFVGVFLAFFGHRQYLLSQFFFGAYGTAVCAFMVVAVINDGILVSYTETIGLSIAIGIIGGFLWVLIWYILGIPFLSTALPIAMVGLLFGGIFVYLPPMNIVSMSSDTIYWTTITAFIVGCLLAILPFTKTASIGSCALIGTFIFIIPIDHYIGSSLKFILVNMVRRAYVDSFDLAVLYFPFQTNDIALVCGWIGLAFISFVVQYSREKNRAPFPPNPYQLRRFVKT
jgi:hypothetical protein